MDLRRPWRSGCLRPAVGVPQRLDEYRSDPFVVHAEEALLVGADQVRERQDHFLGDEPELPSFALDLGWSSSFQLNETPFRDSRRPRALSRGRMSVLRRASEERRTPKE